MQYPCLTLAQLAALEQDFVAFLIVNGIEGETWKTLNETNPTKAQDLANLFSQVVWEKVLKETRYVKRISESDRIFGYLGDDEGVLYIGQQNPSGWMNASRSTDVRIRMDIRPPPPDANETEGITMEFPPCF